MRESERGIYGEATVACAITVVLALQTTGSRSTRLRFAEACTTITSLPGSMGNMFSMNIFK